MVFAVAVVIRAGAVAVAMMVCAVPAAQELPQQHP